MINKRFFTLLTAVFMVLTFSAAAFAANVVDMTTTVPNIPQSTCYQAGTDTLDFDSLTKMEEGDVIEFTLNNGVTVCKTINMFLTLGTTAGVLDTTGNLPVSTTAGAITAAAAGTQFGFLIQATTGSQIIRLTFRRITTATGVLVAVTPGNIMTFTGTALTDRLIVKLFDGKIGAIATSGFQKQAAVPVADTYDTIILASDNALCIDTLTAPYTGEYVQNTPNSIPVAVAQKLNFTGDYVIAHIMTALTYNLYTCKGATCGNIVLGGTTQTAGTCVSFDYETNGTGGNGYCTNHLASAPGVPRLILQASQPFELTNYIVSAEILVNGVAGEHGVYWSSTAPTYGHHATSALACTGGGAGALGATYQLGNGAVAGPVAPIAASCAGVAAAAKAVKWTSAVAGTALFVAGDYFLEVNLPDFNYNLAEVNAGDIVTVRLTVAKSTCGSVGSYDLCIGTFGCPAAAAVGGQCTFPYFTSLSDDPTYWNGIAIVNKSANAGVATITAYEQDGSVGTATVNVGANSMYVNLLESITWTGTGLGGSPAYVVVVGDVFTPDGFGMIANPTSGESMGYLPRQP